MNELSQFLVESILLEAASVDNKVVVYAGRFQPFHRGHYATYSHLVKKFGKDNVYIGTSNKTDNQKSPFNFKEKKQVMTTMFGIPSNKIVEVKNPYQPTEIMSKFDKDTTAFITVVGKKDASRLGGKYFTPYKDNLDFDGYRDKGYVYIAPQQSNPISGTDVRMGLRKGSDEDKKEFFTKKAYGRFNPKIFKFIAGKLSQLPEVTSENIWIPKHMVESWVVNNVELIKEATQTVGKAEVDDGPNFLFPTFKSFDRVSKKRAEQIGYEVLSQIMSDELTDIDPHPIYPKGPVKAVTAFPAGVIGKTTATNQKDFYGSQAYKLWLKHITRLAGLVGYSVIQSLDIETDKEEAEKTKKVKDPNVNIVKEDINIPINVGDTVLGGKFKNKRIVVKTIGKNEKGDITINGKPVLKVRLIEEHIVVEFSGEEIKCEKCNHQWEIESDDNGKYLCHNCGWDSQLKNYDLISLQNWKDSNNIKNKLSESEIVKLKNTLGIERDELPQIDKDSIEDYLEYLESKNIKCEIDLQPVSSLNSSQSNIDLEKVKKMMGSESNNPIIISNDDYILDGHHRALAAYNLDKDSNIQSIKVDLPIDKLIDVSNQFNGSYNEPINEIPMGDLQKIDTYADKQFKPVDVVLTDKHFFDRLNDPRNGKEVTNAELIGFFKRLGKKKKEFVSFLNQYNQIVAKDNRTNLNIPFMKQANKIIAKTIMRKDNFKTSTPEYKFEDKIPGGLASGKTLEDIAKHHNVDITELRDEFDKGMGVEMEHTTDSSIAKEIALDHLYEDPMYYTKLSQIEEVSPHGYPDQKWIDDHNKELKRLRKKFDKEPKEKYYEPALGGGITESTNNQSEEMIRLKELLNEVLLTEGGAYGHMNHPFDTEINLTFGQLKDIVNKALEGNLELAREKTDGQALAVSWRDGRLVAARNKGHLKNKGENALDINGVATKFAGRGELEKAYNFAMKDLSNAISKLSDKQKEKVFKGGACFMNLEVIYPTSVNVIPYGQALLVFHGTMEFNDDGIAIGENQEAARILAGMIKQVNADVQSAYTIQGPPINELPKSKDLSKLKGKYNSQISKLQSKFKLKDNDGIADYHQAFWMDFVNKKSPSKLDNKTLMGLVKRWAFYDKSFRLDKKNITDEKTLEWANGIDKNDHAKIAKDNIRPFEDIFLGIGADILSFMSSVLAANPDKAVRDMKKRLDQTIKDVQKSGDEKKIAKLKLELQRLNAIGGKDKIVPNEGIVFVYNGKTFKLTGTFAPLNQILGLFYE